MRIRPATAADVPAVMVLERAAPTAAHWRETDYARIFAGGHVALVMEGDSVVGFIVARDLGPEWEIENVVVSDRFRRRGLGGRLMAEVFEIAQNRGAQAVFLEVRESNTAARGLYKKTGFVESGRRNAYYRDPDEDALIFKKFLPAATPKKY